MNQVFRFNSISGHNNPSMEQRHLFLVVMLPFASVLMAPAQAAPTFVHTKAKPDHIIALQERQRRLSEYFAQGINPEDFQIIPYETETANHTHRPDFSAFTTASPLIVTSELTSVATTTEASLTETTAYKIQNPKRGPPLCILT